MKAKIIGAHPRAGGENADRQSSRWPQIGSSPRWRGKRTRLFTGTISGRLIPALAGKTKGHDAPPLHEWAHPRAGGENDQRCGTLDHS